MVVKVGNSGILIDAAFQRDADRITDLYQLGLGSTFDGAVQQVPNPAEAKNDATFEQAEPERVDLSELDVGEQQQILSDAGFYVTDPNHRFYGDEIPGPVTNHAIALYENPEYAASHIVTAMNDPKLTESEMMMLQGDFKALGFDVGVTGRLDDATRAAIDSYVEQNPNIESPKFLGEDGSLNTSSTLNQQWNEFTAKLDDSNFLSPLLGHIRYYEAKGGNYNIEAGGAIKPYTTMTIDEVMESQVKSLAAQKAAGVPDGELSTAAGAYQINHPTMETVVSGMGLKGDELFDKAMQDSMAEHLLVTRGGLEELVSGEISELAALHDMSKIWAAIPDPKAGGESHYKGVGNNRALTSVDKMVDTLKQVKSKFEVAQQEEAVTTPIAGTTTTFTNDLG